MTGVQTCALPIFKNSEYYTFDGDLIEHTGPGKLDPDAQKPQPTLCVIKYRYGFFGLTGGKSGYYVLFYDKNGNVITRCRASEGTVIEEIRPTSLDNILEKLDVSNIKKIKFYEPDNDEFCNYILDPSSSSFRETLDSILPDVKEKERQVKRWKCVIQ